MLTDKQSKNFWNKIDKSLHGCWNWIGSKNNGYGIFKLNYKKTYAHRLSFELNIGNIPADLQVLHKCDNPSCVNPNHLFLGTHQENMKDRNSKGRTSTVPRNCGELCWSSKLTENQIIEIKLLLDEGILNCKQIAGQFNTSRQNISHIKNKRRWKHLFK